MALGVCLEEISDSHSALFTQKKEQESKVICMHVWVPLNIVGETEEGSASAAAAASVWREISRGCLYML